jgi:glycosyltransferase involved in cell wall biosynthesis
MMGTDDDGVMLNSALEAPALSIVVPTYNRRDGIVRLLKALEAQTFGPERFEVVVVNDGSTDGTAEALAELTAPYRLRVLEQANAGPAAARNLGLHQAEGRLIVFLDDDVVPVPGLLSAHLACHGDADDLVVVGPMSPPTDWPRSAWVRWEERQLLKQYDAMDQGLYSCTPRQFYTGNASAPRALLLRAGGFDARFKRAEDVELAFRMYGMGARFHFEPSADVLHYASRSFQSWMRTPYQYGRYDVVMGREKGINTFEFACQEFERRHALSQRLTRLCVGRPWRRLAVAGLFLAAMVADRIGLESGGSFALSAIFSLQYWQGASDELGGPAPVWSAVAEPSRVRALLGRA